MDYPWSKKTKEEVPDEMEDTEKKEVIIEEDSTTIDKEEIIEDTGSEEENTVWDNDDPRSILLNILKLEGYKMDSGELFNAYREASGEEESSKIMESFKKGLDNLSELGKIRSDTNGNIMTTQDYDREKSQTTNDEEQEEEIMEEAEKVVEDLEDNKVSDLEEKEENITESKEDGADDLESIIKLKEETDSWLIEKLKNSKSNDNETELREEVKELRQRIEKLEGVIKNITKAFE
jgi:hypothetical protein